jgi:hypothetical protein
VDARLTAHSSPAEALGVYYMQMVFLTRFAMTALL